MGAEGEEGFWGWGCEVEWCETGWGWVMIAGVVWHKRNLGDGDWLVMNMIPWGTGSWRLLGMTKKDGDEELACRICLARTEG